MPSRRVFCILWTALVLCSVPAFAERALREPAALQEWVARTPKRDQTQAFRAAGVLPLCSAGQVASPDLSGLVCRAALMSYRAEHHQIRKLADVNRQLQEAETAWTLATALAAYQPLSPPPDAAAHRYQAHHLACRALLATLDGLSGVGKRGSAEVRTAAQDGLKNFPHGTETPLLESSCRCLAKSVELAGSAGLPLEEVAKLQQTLSARSCFLDADKVKSSQKNKNLAFSDAAQSATVGPSDEQKLLAYAQSRDLGLARCRDKDLPLGQIRDRARLERCVCGEISRWSFPKKKGRPELDILVPLAEKRLGVTTRVRANGTVSGCGPLTGPLVTP
jgi:hypothetical protein